MTTATATRPRRTYKRPADATPPPEIEWQKALEVALTVPGSTGDVYSRFHSYSYLNGILLRMQGATEPCASYARWQGMGRQVRKGESGLFVNRPIMVKRREQDSDGNDQFFQKFRMVKGAFQYSQTDGPDIPWPESPEWCADTAHSALKINVMPWSMLDGNVQGYSQGRSYALNPVAAFPHLTRLHEIAHIVLGHTSEPAEYVMHRGLFEFEAEATAFLVANELGILDDRAASKSRAYVQGWLADQHPGDRAIRRVFKATNELLTAGRPAVAESA